MLLIIIEINPLFFFNWIVIDCLIPKDKIWIIILNKESEKLNFPNSVSDRDLINKNVKKNWNNKEKKLEYKRLRMPLKKDKFCN